jgi:hypothetical protein
MKRALYHCAALRVPISRRPAKVRARLLQQMSAMTCGGSSARVEATRPRRHTGQADGHSCISIDTWRDALPARRAFKASSGHGSSARGRRKAPRIGVANNVDEAGADARIDGSKAVIEKFKMMVCPVAIQFLRRVSSRRTCQRAVSWAILRLERSLDGASSKPR